MQKTPKWKTSSYSGSDGNCVEVSLDTTAVGIRDTKDRGGAVLTVAPQTWAEFTGRIRTVGL